MSADEIALQFVASLKAHGWTVAFAESCTGGAVSACVARVPGASHVLRGGIVAYSEAVKRDILRVPASALASEGPVSSVVARAMALHACEMFTADVGVAVTGYAGPNAPPGRLGEVWVAACAPPLPQLSKGRTEMRFLRASGTRLDVIAAAVDASLRLGLALLPPPDA